MNKIWTKRSALLFALCLLLVNTSGCEHLWNAEQRGESSASIPVPDSIKVNIPGPAVEISGGIYEMKVGEVLYPYIEALPTGTSYKLNASTFSANNDDIIQVQESSIIGKAPGTAMVTATCIYSSGSYEVALTAQFEIRITTDQPPTTTAATTKKTKAKNTTVAKLQPKPAMTAVLSMVQTTARTPATTMRTIAKTTVATTARTTAKTTTGVTSTKLTTTSTTTTATTGTSASTTVTTPTTVLVPVKKITGIPTTMKEFETITLNGEIMPKNATKKRIIWSILSGDMYVSLKDNNQLTSTGGVGVPPVIRATIKDGLGLGKDYVEDFTIQMEYN